MFIIYWSLDGQFILLNFHCWLSYKCYYTGLLDAVAELQLNKVNASTLLISWNPPYTLEGVPILYYCIKVNSSLNIHTENTTSLYYYSVIDIKPAQTEINVAVTILPVNKVGEGMATSVYTSILLKKGVSIRNIAIVC